MIAFFEYGQLGNQLFQYAYFTQNFTEHKIYLFGFSGLRTLFVEPASKTKPYIVNINPFTKLIYSILLIAARFRLIGILYEHRLEGSYSVKARRGLFLNSYVVMPSFFQHESFTTQICLPLEIRRQYLDSARQWIRMRDLKKEQNLVFFHVRRGDYLTWPSEQYPAALDVEWYLKAARYIEERIVNPYFIVVTDDPAYCREKLAYICTRGILSAENMMMDLVLMSICGHGVMSASTFSWWGAWLSRRNNREGSALFVAPEFWVGHCVREWYPPGFKSGWITYI